METLPDLTPEHFEILVTRELRKIGLAVSELRIHRRATLSEPQQGYLLELKGVVSGTLGQRRVLIACRRQAGPVARTDVESLKSHFKEAGVEAGLLFATADFDADALSAAQDSNVALLRVTDGRTAFDTSGWGTPGHYPAWLPAYCAQAVGRDPIGQPRYQLLERGQGDLILRGLQTERGQSGEPTR
jgi:hypothetical protein